MLFMKKQRVLINKCGDIVRLNIQQIKPKGSRHTYLFVQHKGKLRQVEIGRHNGEKLFKIL